MYVWHGKIVSVCGEAASFKLSSMMESDSNCKWLCERDDVRSKAELWWCVHI